MRILIILFLFLASSLAHARLTLHCVAEIYPDFDDPTSQHIFENQQYEFQEQDLQLIPSKVEGQHQSKNRFRFRLLPGLTTHITVSEKLLDQTVTWSSKMSISEEGSGKILGQGKDSVVLKAKGKKVRAVTCDAYDKTTKISAVDPVDQRSLLRAKLLQGYAATRSYANTERALKALDVYDLFNQLLQMDDPEADRLKARVNQLEMDGFQLHTLSQIDVVNYLESASFSLKESDVSCGKFATQDFKCDVETFEMTPTFYRIPYGKSPDPQLGIVTINGLIYRERNTRMILGYQLESFAVEMTTPEIGGGSSSSGGRINGGN